MGTKRHGDKIVVDLAKFVIWLFDSSSSLTAQQLHEAVDRIQGNKSVSLTIAKLRRRGWLIGGAKTGYKLSNSGYEKLENLRFEKIISSSEWDRKWRLISYDIPESNRIARDTVRRLVKQLGCKQLQLSLWAHPYPCLKQFEIISSNYKLSNHLFMLEVDHDIQFTELLTAFRATYPKL
ncbi:hypothetical protein HY003_02910 [Candidatus Saccharibacteria bacterium]|nr:hypothetical protein [Candidatus Saccharibacteria bacterium]MBI3338224.1 hypothetical protein [Candidatus Saccharibacteria bacterium]